MPPAAAKSAFYSNPLTRQLWQTAAAALTSADTVTLVGYSLPATDLVTSGMLAERLTESPTRVEVVNPSPEVVAQRLQLLGIREDVITTIEGDDAVKRFVDQLEAEASQSVTPAITSMEGNPLLMIAADDLRMSAVIRVEPSDHVIRLITARPSDPGQAIRPDYYREAPPVGLDALRTAIGGNTLKTLVAVLDGRFDCPIVDHQKWVVGIGAGDGRWLVLTPAAAPTESSWGWRQ